MAKWKMRVTRMVEMRVDITVEAETAEEAFDAATLASTSVAQNDDLPWQTFGVGASVGDPHETRRDEPDYVVQAGRLVTADDAAAAAVAAIGGFGPPRKKDE